MPKSRSHTKYIACLESLWDSNLEDRLNVKPILELLSTCRGIRHIYLTCNTIDELTFNLKRIPKRKYYSILYLGFHGSAGKVYLADKSELGLDELANKMEDRFQNWIIHFGSCATVAAGDEMLTDFMQKTDVALIIGYNKNVDWIQSAALDMLIFDWLQEYKNLGAFIKKFKSLYPDLIAATGLRFFQG